MNNEVMNEKNNASKAKHTMQFGLYQCITLWTWTGLLSRWQALFARSGGQPEVCRPPDGGRY